MAIDVRPLKLVDNVDILNAIREDASSDYQRRIPEATKAGLQDQLRHLEDFGPGWNEFQDSLINRIGLVLIKNTSWTNPLAMFKRGMLTYGNTIEEIQMGLITAKGYDADREELEAELFGRAPLDVQTNFHKINRTDKYKISVNPDLLKRAFLDDGGLGNFLTDTLSVPTTSDQWDEFLITCKLISEYASNGGFFKVHVPDVVSATSDGTDARSILRTMRAMAGNLKFISSRYNAAHMPMAATPDELIVICSPEFNAAVDVEALAGAFNISKAEMFGRIVEIPQEQFGIDGAQAVMTTKDFFVIADNKIENTSMYNPSSLHSNYWLHHWQVISASRFVPAILFTTGAGDDIIQVSTPVTSVTAVTTIDRNGDTVTSVYRGEIYSLNADAVTGNPDSVNTGVRWSITGNTSNRTYVTLSGVLHVGGDEGATAITATATSTWLDPAGIMRNGKASSESLTVTGDAVADWPEVDTLTGITVKGVAVTLVAGTYTYSVAVTGGTITATDVVVAGVDSSNVTTTVNTAGTQAKIELDSVAGDPVYTINVTTA